MPRPSAPGERDRTCVIPGPPRLTSHKLSSSFRGLPRGLVVSRLGRLVAPLMLCEVGAAWHRCDHRPAAERTRTATTASRSVAAAGAVVHPTAQHHPATRRLFGANSWSPLVLQDRTVRQRTPSACRMRRTWLRPAWMPLAWAAWARASRVQCADAWASAASRLPSAGGPLPTSTPRPSAASHRHALRPAAPPPDRVTCRSCQVLMAHDRAMAEAQRELACMRVR